MAKTLSDSHYRESEEEHNKRIHRGEKEYTPEQEDMDMDKYYEEKEANLDK